jgi:OmpA-OmpF porin, OOP family
MNARLNPPILALAVALGAAAAMPAHAEDMYAGGELGTPGYREGGINGVAGNGSGVSGKVFGGVQVAPHVAVEAGAAALGHIDDASGTARGQSLFVDMVGSMPVAKDWSVLGRLGAARANVETSNGDDHGAGLNYGAGVQYQINPSVALRGEWEDYRLALFDGHPNIHQYSVGLKLGF